MKKLRNPLIILAGQILVAGVVALTASHLGHDQRVPVPGNTEVTNKSPEQGPAIVSPTFNSDAFHFLEPLAPNAGNPERFDASLLNYLSVEICRVSASDCTIVKTFTSQGLNSEQLRIESAPRDGSFYIVNWDTQHSNHLETYRVCVMLAGFQMGSIDLTPDVYNTFGRTWPIKFLIEKDPVIRVRLMRFLGKSCSQVASMLKTEFNLSAEDVASLLANDQVPCSAAEIELAINGVFQHTVVPDTTKTSDEATRNALSSYDPVTGRLIFSVKTPLLNSLRAGDVLVSEPSIAAPNGYLRKVIRKTNGGLVLETSQATFNDAIQQGTFAAAGDIRPSDLLRTEAALPGVTSRTLSRAREISPAAGVIGDDYDFETSVDITLNGATSGGGVSGDAFVRIQGYIRFNAGYNVDFGLDPCLDIPPVCVDRVEGRLGVDQYSNLRVSGEFNGTLEKEVKLTTHYFKPIVFFIGPIPVVLVPVIDVVVGVNGEAHLKFSFAAELSTQLQLGARWTDPDDDGRGWEDLSRKNGVQAGVTEQNLDANMKLRGYGKADAKLLFYGVAGPGFASRVGGGVDVQIPRKPWWKIFGYIGASINFQVDLGGIIKLSEFSKTVLDEEFMLAQATNQAPLFSNVNTGVIQADIGSLVILGPRAGFSGYFDVTDLEGDPFTLTAVSNIDGPIGLAHRFQTGGQRIITITALDNEGASSSITLTVNVNNSLPVVTVTGPSNIPATVQYFATARAYDWESGFLRCDRLNWHVTSPDTLTVRSSDGTCRATVIFAQEGVRALTVTATDPHGGIGSQTMFVTVTRAPENSSPIIVPESFHVKAVPSPGVDTTGCPIFVIRCEVPDGAILYNGQAGDYRPPLYLSLQASDPDGPPPTVQWYCLTGTNPALVTPNGDGTFQCSPHVQPDYPIYVYAVVSDGVNQVVSEQRTYFMDDLTN